MEVELVTRKENREYGIDLEKNICPQFDRLKLKYEQDTQEDCLRESPPSREICAIVLVPLFESGNVGKHKPTYLERMCRKTTGDSQGWNFRHH